MDLQTMLHQAAQANKQNRIQLMAQEQARYAPAPEESINDQMLAEVLGQQVRHQLAGLPSQQAITSPAAAPVPVAPVQNPLAGMDLAGALQGVGRAVAAVPQGPLDLAAMLATYLGNQNMPAPQQAPVQDTLPVQRPMAEAAPAVTPAQPAASPQDIVAALQGAGQTSSPGSLESALGGDSVTPAEPGFFDKLKAFIGDPAVSRMLLQAGASMDAGGTLAMGLNDGIKVYDSVRQTQADAPYQQRKKELGLKKTSAEIGQIISSAGRDLQEGYLAGEKGAMTKYNSETDRIKAEASRSQAEAAMKQAQIDSQKLIKSLEKEDQVDDKSYATLFATMQESSNNNPMIRPMLETKGLDTTEFTALTLNSSLKPENKRYQPIKSTVVDSMRQEYQQLTSAPDTPESREAIKQWRNRMEDYKEIYGRDALMPIIKGN